MPLNLRNYFYIIVSVYFLYGCKNILRFVKIEVQRANDILMEDIFHNLKETSETHLETFQKYMIEIFTRTVYVF